jgi:hypothetical protein
MATERFDMPAGLAGQEQYAMVERRPTREQIKEIERRTRQALRGDQAMDAEDWMVVTLVTEWQVFDRDGNPVPLRTGKAFDAIQADVLQPLVDECNAVVASVNRGNAMAQITSTLRSMAWSLDEQQAARLSDLTDELHTLFGVTPPNRTAQAAS